MSKNGPQGVHRGLQTNVCKVGSIIQRTAKMKMLIVLFRGLSLKMERGAALVVLVSLVALDASNLATAAPMNICKYQKAQR
jgi:hypothetical protein